MTEIRAVTLTSLSTLGMTTRGSGLSDTVLLYEIESCPSSLKMAHY